jgi:hypothetical protein
MAIADRSSLDIFILSLKYCTMYVPVLSEKLLSISTITNVNLTNNRQNGAFHLNVVCGKGPVNDLHLCMEFHFGKSQKSETSQVIRQIKNLKEGKSESLISLIIMIFMSFSIGGGLEG